MIFVGSLESCLVWGWSRLRIQYCSLSASTALYNRSVLGHHVQEDQIRDVFVSGPNDRNDVQR